MSALFSTLQDAVEAALRADDNLKTAMGGAVRIYDTVPNGAPFPYLVHGAPQFVPDLAEGHHGKDAFVEIHVWSRPEPPSLGKREAGDIACAAQEALLTDLDLGAWRLTDAVPEDLRVFDDGDGLTKHGVLTVRYLTEPA